MSETTKDDLVFSAKLAEQAERFEDMVSAMKSVVATGIELTNEERNLLSVAFKNLVGTRRYSWRIVKSLEQKPETSSKKQELVKEYKANIEKELKELCLDIIGLVDSSLLPKANSIESTVFYLKMKGDYCRYLAEIATEDVKDKAVEDSCKAYQDAFEIANAEMAPTNPVRLGLALNYSVFYYEILNNQMEACRIAKQAFDNAIAELDTLNEESFKDSTMIMQLIRDNLTIWHTDHETEEPLDVGDN